MSELIKLCAVGLTGGLLALTVRKEKPEFSLLIALGASAVILLGVIGSIGNVLEELKAMIERCGVDIRYFTICIRAAGIAYIAQFAAEILRDCGESAIASKVEAAGKISILVLTIPVMKSLLEMCVKVVNTV